MGRLGPSLHWDYGSGNLDTGRRSHAHARLVSVTTNRSKQLDAKRDYEQIEAARRRAWKAARSFYDPAERALHARRYENLKAQREQYLRELLVLLPFRWHVEHAYTPRETATYGGADHIIVDEGVRIGRLVRHPGDALSRSRQKFWGLNAVEDGRLPSALADIKIAERIVSAGKQPKKSVKQLKAEIAEVLRYQ
jgi:hypothetical protein